MNNHHENISVNIRSVIPTDVLNYREAKEINLKALYGNGSSQKRYLLNIKVSVPPSERDQTRQIGSTVSYPWQESKGRRARELSLNPSSIRWNFTFTISFSKTRTSLGLEKAGSATTGLVQVRAGRATWEKLLQPLCGWATALPDAIASSRSKKNHPPKPNYSTS